ncbi:hypothetical protein BGW39_009392 [Mortierella sp. 14UC]|nr:hypothetical protein BGW39_009392 [Mortierella sp. 14UC]
MAMDSSNKHAPIRPFLTLATVALGASASVNADVNILNPGTLAARSLNINIHANTNADVKSESSTVRHPITVELGKPLHINTDELNQDESKPVEVNKAGHKLINVDLSPRHGVNADLLKEDQPVDVTVAKIANLNTETAHTQDSKLVNLDLNRRLDVKADVLSQDKKLVDAHVVKHLDLNIGANAQERQKLISVDLGQRSVDATILPVDAANPQAANISVARGRMPTAIEVTRRHLNVNANAQTTITTAQENNSPVDINTSSDTLGLDINALLAKEHKLITVNLGNKKRNLQMSTGSMPMPTPKLSKKRDLNANAKSDIQPLAARHKDDNDDDWENEDEDKVLNEQDSITKGNNKVADKKNSAPSAADDKNSEDGKSTTGQKKNAVSRSSAFAGLLIVGLLVGSAFLWA